MVKINPFVKAVTVIAAAVLLSFSRSVILNLGVFAAAMLLTVIAPVSKRHLPKIMIPILIAAFALFMTGMGHAGSAEAEELAFGTVSFDAVTTRASTLYQSAQLATRVLAFAGMGILFALTTIPVEFMLSLIHQGRMKPKFAYGVLAAYHLIPGISREWTQAKLARRTRGVSTGPLGLKAFFSAMVNCIRWSENVAMAMESKGFDSEGTRTYYRRMKVVRTDLVFSVLWLGGIVCGMIFLKR